ncbi:MAG: protein bax [Candidatus Phlomobacter fragariae]
MPAQTMRTNAVFAFLMLLFSTSFSYSSTSTSLFLKEYYHKPVQKKELTRLPYMRKYLSRAARKKAFLKAIVPIIEKYNYKIMQDRQWLLSKRYNKNWNATDKQRLNQICTNYNIQYSSPTSLNWNKLLSRVDIIPTHFVVTQAATESGWGASSLAQKNNNLFGMKCGRKCTYSKGTTKGYAIYPSVDTSINAYLKNLNTNNAYQLLRHSRAQQRRTQYSLNTSVLIDNLKNYSQLGRAYNRYLQQMFSSNEKLITQVQQNMPKHI